METINRERVQRIFRFMDPTVRLQDDVYQVIEQLLRPWVEGIFSLTKDEQINQFMSTYFPPEIFQLACQHLDELTRETDLKDETLVVTLGQKQTRLVEVLLAAILEMALENAQECLYKEVDAYDVYVGIQKNFALTHLFGSMVPAFQYSDNLLIHEILEMLRPDLETTRGCRVGLENYIGTLIGLTTNYTPQMIDQLANQFILNPQSSRSRIEAIRRLKISVVDYFFRHTNINAETKRTLTFIDAVNAINTMNLVVTIKSVDSQGFSPSHPIFTNPPMYSPGL